MLDEQPQCRLMDVQMPDHSGLSRGRLLAGRPGRLIEDQTALLLRPETRPFLSHLYWKILGKEVGKRFLGGTFPVFA